MSIENRLSVFCLRSIILILVSATSLAGCTIAGFKSQKPQEAIEKQFVGGKGGTKRTYFGLQAEVMAFSDQYVATVWEAMDKILMRTNDPEKSLALQYRKLALTTHAMRIAAGRNPAANLLDMVVFVTLQHRVDKEYWVPEVYGSEGKVLVDAHIRLEKEIWALAGEMLSRGQLQKLRDMIEEWRAAHPQQHYVIDVRLKALAELRGKYPGERAQDVNSLMGQVQKSLEKVDDAMLMAERVMFYIERGNRIVSLQTELMMAQITAKREVRQLEDHVHRLTKAVEDATQTFRNSPIGCTPNAEKPLVK